MLRRQSFALLFLWFPLALITASPIQERADRFLKLTNAGYQALYRVNSEAQWTAVTDVTPEHDAAAEAVGKAYAACNGNPAIISEARELLTHQNELNELTVRQLKQLLLNAAEGPMTNPDLVAQRGAAETKLASILNSFKFKMTEKFHQPVPKKIPAHWVNNRWGQEWPGLVEAANIDKYFEGRKPEWIIKTAEQFYTGLGFSPLPQTFWEKSDLYPLPPDSKRKKNTHASCSHIDLENDIRSLQSIEPNARWFFTAHHELGHGYYFKAYTRPEVPYLLRTGAAPGFHEGVGELISLASSQVPYLQSRGILPADFKPDKTAFLLDDALARSVPFIYFSCGVMPHWEADIYAHNLPPDQWNARWWKYVSDFQGIEPPSPRSEELCDAATKTHINDNPAYYYNYAFATVFKFQLHDYIARNILHQPPQSCNYADDKEVGAWLNNILKKGGTEDWRKVLKEATGEDISTRAMMDYFKPLMTWLEEQNKGRQIGWE